MEDPSEDGGLPFLDTLLSSDSDNILTTTVYRKPRHVGQYLHWDSNLFISAKSSIFNTLAYMDRVICMNQLTLQQENEHVRKAMLAYNLP